MIIVFFTEKIASGGEKLGSKRAETSKNGVFGPDFFGVYLVVIGW